jgi:glycerophosphoryl diester phosphodiesterase
MFTRRHLLLAVSAAAAGCAALPPRSVKPASVLVLAHRGASGVRPEHTLQAYRLGAEQGADAIEPDLVMSRDGVLIARHDHFLGASTNVSVRFPERRRAGLGVTEPDWFSEDFTLNELNTLRARQPRPRRDQQFNDRFAIPTFAQILDLRATLEAELKRPLYVYPELKLPAYFAERGLDPVAALIAEWQRRTSAERARIWLQCFEPEPLRRLRTTLGNSIWLTQLLPSNVSGQPLELALSEIAEYANAIGPPKAALRDAAGLDSGLVSRAHALGLNVHTWTFRDDELPRGVASVEAELHSVFALGVDGVFSDFPSSAVAARESFRNR